MDILAYPFFQNALAGVIIISIAAAIIGTYVVTRRTVFIAGGITHACFGGLGLGYYLGISPTACAALFAVAGSLGVESLAGRHVRKDSAIAVVWAFGMALGTLFIFLSSGYVPELNTFLFGNVLTITPADNILFLIFTLTLILVYILFYRRIVAISFDPDFAATRRLPVRTIETIMTILTAIAIVLTIRMIGIMLLISLISLPQLIAETRCTRYLPLLLASGAVSLAACVGGLFAAYWLSVPASAAIVLILVLLYIPAQFLSRTAGAR